MRKILIIVLFIPCTFLQSQNWDINLLREINVNRNRNLDGTFSFLSYSVAPVSLGAPVIVFGLGWLKDDGDLRQKGLMMGASMFLSTAIATTMKYTINRTRPFDKYQDIEQVIPVHTASFPSGHTSSAFTTATSLSLAFPKWYVIAPSYIWASSVGYSRMHLGEHYPSDVLVGALIGMGSSYLCYKGQQWFNKRAKHLVKN